MSWSFSIFVSIALILFSVVASQEIHNKLKFRDLLLQPSIFRNEDEKEADIKDHPFQVALYKYQNDYAFLCGGMIISKDYVLTAAHCLEGLNSNQVYVSVGSTWLANGTLIGVAKLILHPEYNTATTDNDVGVIRTASSIQFSDVIQPIKLQPKQKRLKAGSLLTVTGWGATEKNDSSEHLRSVQIPVVNFHKCWAAYNNIGLTVTKNMLCAGDFKRGGVGPCDGDSGGPAVYDNMAVGIVSWGLQRCVPPKFPAVFTDIAAPSIRDFITKHTGL